MRSPDVEYVILVTILALLAMHTYLVFKIADLKHEILQIELIQDRHARELHMLNCEIKPLGKGRVVDFERRQVGE